MDVEDDKGESSASSAVRESNEELVWVNSCLVGDTEILESKWTSFKDVLVEIVGDGDQPESRGSSATENDGFAGGAELNIVPPIEEAGGANESGRTHEEGLVAVPVNGDSDLEIQDETNSSTADLFRVWDLNIPDEEDDVIKQLSQAFFDTNTSF
ncbi:hypothetical protein DITRI_Ditri01bG0044000 [Diplodiscus trichospermus]